jgi:hypothetical protein
MGAAPSCEKPSSGAPPSPRPPSRDLLPFCQVGRDVFAAPQDHAGPIGFFFPLAGLLIFPAAAGSYGKFRHRNLRGGVGGFGVPAEMPDQDHFVNAAACHDFQNYHTGTSRVPLTKKRQRKLSTFK